MGCACGQKSPVDTSTRAAAGEAKSKTFTRPVGKDSELAQFVSAPLFPLRLPGDGDQCQAERAGTFAVAIATQLGVDTEEIHDSGAARAPMGTELSDGAVTTQNSLPLDSSAADCLKKYVGRNKPSNRHKFMSLPSGVSDIGDAGGDAVGANMEEPPGASRQNRFTESNAQMLERKMIAYDIFDAIDAERLQDFDEIFKKIKTASNYEAHKKKSKRIDPKKFVSCSVVNTDETGLSVLT